ncbi:MAG: T9SS type A sorting domain-containing protein [Bacteroidales bacterium]|nr:T9SS type A sorting domain-containing protein [Bacteroidales bacterium]
MKAKHIFKQILLLLLFTVPVGLCAQTDSVKNVYPSATITPFELPDSDAVNFPLDQATPVGDINGDGLMDMVFTRYAADERTPEETDRVRKSLITTSSGIDPEAIVFYNSLVYGIGDYDGDGYDDIIDIEQCVIRFGSPSGFRTDSLIVNLPENCDFYYAGDINDDGKSEVLIGDRESNQTLYVFSGPDTAAVIMESGGYPLYFDTDRVFFYIDDFDADGTNELCVAAVDNYNDARLVRFFNFDKEAHEITIEQSFSIPYIHEPSSHYTTAFCDLNGDQQIDIAHAFYVPESMGEFDLEVFFGKASAPYFDDPVVVQLRNHGRMLYMGGDFNNDGADDWYSKYGADTIAVFYGHDQAANEGIQPVFYNHGSMQELLLKGPFSGAFYTVGRMDAFDYNGDSFADLAFNYWSYDENLRFETIGTAIVLGGDTPDFLNPVIIGRTGDQTYQNLEFGFQAQKIKDINQDGYDDWGILARGGCYLNVYFGGPEFDMEPDIRYLLPQTSKALCHDWTSGDMNGDGYTDIAIANSSESTVRFTSGTIPEREDIFIFFGSPNLQSTYNYQDADVVLHDNDTFYSYGYNLCIVGDYNADGFDDLVVGGGKHRYCLREAFVYFGSDSQIGPEPDLVISVPCTQCGILFAHPITPCGDVNADGYDDFTLGDPNNGDGQSLVYFGGPNADAYYDKALVNPFTNGRNYGANTAMSPGDYNGDGYNDLIHYSYFAKTIYVYYGGPNMNSQYDLTIADSTFSNSIHCFDFVDRKMEKEASDIIAGFRHAYGYDYYLYAGGGIPAQSPSFVLKNGLALPGRSVASGDFNNDGIAEIFAGVPFEYNYGNTGGVAYFYEPLLATSVPEDAARINEVCHIFPNPATDIINIRSEVFIDDVQILNASGVLVSHLRPGAKSSFLKIESSKSSSGLYFIKITCGNDVITKKVVIQ